MTQELSANIVSFQHMFSNLTMPQALFLCGGCVGGGMVLVAAIRHGYVPDLDFANMRFRLLPQECLKALQSI